MTLKKRKGIETQVPKCRIHCQNTFARLLCQTLTFWFPRWLSGSISSATVSISPIPSTAPPTFHRGRAAPGLPNRWWLVGRIQNFATPPPSVWAGRRPEKKCCWKNKKITEFNQSICTVSRAKALEKKKNKNTEHTVVATAASNSVTHVSCWVWMFRNTCSPWAISSCMGPAMSLLSSHCNEFKYRVNSSTLSPLSPAFVMCSCNCSFAASTRSFNSCSAATADRWAWMSANRSLCCCKPV